LVIDKYLISRHEPLKNWISYMAAAGIRGPNGLDLLIIMVLYTSGMVTQ
jgi:hypothetical protein